MIKSLLTLFFILQLLLPQLASAQSVLTRINKISTKDTVELYCSFNKIPKFRSNIRGKRVDFILENTILDPSFTFFEADGKIVKFLSLNKNNKTILSFFFRYPPQNFKIVAQENENKLTISILLGNPYSTALPDFSSKLDGLTIIERTTKDFSNPLIASPYAADWRSFFKSYEPEIKLSLPVQFTVLPFPAMALLPDGKNNRALLSEEIYALADQQLWPNILPLLLEKINSETDPDIKRKLALTYGDVLSRNNNFVDAFKQFYLLADEYADEEIGIFAKYLLILLRARLEDPFIADYELRNLQETISANNPLAPYFLLTQIETALATGQYTRMQKLLSRDDTGFPGNTLIVKELRQADYWYGTGDLVKAYIGYQLLENNDILHKKIFSLNGYCDTLYQQQQYEEASQCYTTLSGQVKSKEKLGLITYRKYMSDLHYKNPIEMSDYFARIENTYPGTEAGFRGAIKKTDLQYLYLKDWSANALLYYNAYSEKSMSRSDREETSLKVALIYRLNKDYIQSIKHIVPFLRDFRKGPLHQTGQALLIELFPLVIKEYVANKMYMEALVLAKQNRKLFLKNWVDIGLLAELAESYNAIGVYNEASKFYLYLITLSSEDKKEQYYLPLIKSAFDHGAYEVVEDYTDQYNFRYPKGHDQTDILVIRIKSLLAEENYPKALELLPKTIPETEAFSLLAASIYFHENNYNRVIEILDRQIPLSGANKDLAHFMLAESFYQNDMLGKAAPFFKKISIEFAQHDFALYRRAAILQKTGKSNQALNLYKELVETGKNPLWIKMATKELQLNKVL
jgi:hypothetical protein